MSLFRRIATPVLGAAGIVFAVPFAAVAADDEHSGHNMDHQTDHSMDHSGHDTGSGSHIHHQHMAGGWMFEYKFMRMTMDGLLDGTDSVNTRDISGATMGMPPTNNMMTPYMMSPTSMDMDMHMLMAMYGISDKLTLMGMVNYLSNDMDMAMHMYTPTNVYAGDMTGSMDTSGVGDARIDGMFTLSKNLMVSIGLSIPIGGIDEKVTMKMTGTNILNGMPMAVTNGPMQAPYSMQLGSGTYDLIPSVTYQETRGDWNWGGQGTYTYRIGENDNDYTLGNRIEVTGWAKRRVNNTVVLTGRLNWNKWGNVDGADPDLNPMMAPTADPDAQGGSRLDALVGINGMFAGGHMLGLEIGVPVKQDLDGPQMETDMLVTFAYQYMMM